MSYLIPTVIEESGRERTAYDIYSKLLKERIIFLGSPIVPEISNMIIAQMLHLESDNPDKEINLYINSPGGDIDSGLAIYDTMQYIRAPVTTICVGRAYSMAAILLTAGAAEKRYALPNAKIMIHQPWGGASGQATELEIEAKEFIKARSILCQILAKHTGQPIKKIEKDTDRNFYMNAQEAKEYKIIDEVLVSRG